MFDNFHQTKHPQTLSRMVGRLINEGREVHDDDFPEIRSQFSKMDWYKFLLVEESTLPHHVHEFYANFEFVADEDLVNFRMFGKNYSYDVEEFGNLLDIGTPGVAYTFYYPGKDLEVIAARFPIQPVMEEICRPDISYNTVKNTGILDSYIRPELAVQVEIIRSNIFHREENDNCLSLSEVIILWCLINGHRIIKMGHLVASRMSELHRDQTKSLPYGALLNRLFGNIGVLCLGPRSPFVPMSTLPIRSALPFRRVPSSETQSADETSRFPSDSDSGTSSTRSDARSYARR